MYFVIYYLVIIKITIHTRLVCMRTVVGGGGALTLFFWGEDVT